MHTKRMTVTVNGPVIINVAGVVRETDSKKQRERKRREICSLIERIQTNPRDNEAVEELLRRFRGMVRSEVKNHNVQSSERDFMQGVAEARDGYLDRKGHVSRVYPLYSRGNQAADLEAGELHEAHRL